MRAPPFDTIEARKMIYDAVSDLPGVSVEERLNGRPSFPMAELATGDNLERLLKILEGAVDQMVEHHKQKTASSQ